MKFSLKAFGLSTRISLTSGVQIQEILNLWDKGNHAADKQFLLAMCASCSRAPPAAPVQPQLLHFMLKLPENQPQKAADKDPRA